MIEYKDQVNELIDSAEYLISNILPSDWAEKFRIMTSDVSPWPGPYRFVRSPYLKEICDTVSPTHPARKIVVMKGAQIGFSVGVIENAIGYIIRENPGNILFLTGAQELAEEAMSTKIDQMIDSCGLRNLIRPNVLRKKNQRTGDTNKSKEFPGGSLIAGSATNHKLLRQRSVRYGFFDDYDAVKHKSKESGSTTKLIEKRFAAYADKMKLYFISTPEVDQTSNIKPLFLKGDQRKFHVPCPCCGDFIVLEWTISIKEKTYGITYQVDEKGEVVEGSVGYTCQSCGEFFTDKHKHDMLNTGIWKPTAKSKERGLYSYHLSALYAPVGMFDWEDIVIDFLQANPKNAPQRIAEMQTFTNLVLGETFVEKGEEPKSNQLQRNVRDYEVNELPEKLSSQDGNGRIVLLTCAADLNGKIDDARLDYEIVAWTERGPSYSIDHGSIGTFIPNQSQRQKDKVDRLHWTYRLGERNSVWDEFSRIIKQEFTTDTGRKMQIACTGVDTGNTYLGHAYEYVDFMKGSGATVFAVKGKDEFAYRRVGIDTPVFKIGRERSDLFIVEVNQLKDDLAEHMKLRWHQSKEYDQPVNFMNFPTPSKKKYTYTNYFSHYESEHRILDKNEDGEGIKFVWKKKSANAQNHLFDCRIYNMALREIFTAILCKEMGIKKPNWKDFIDGFFGNA